MENDTEQTIKYIINGKKLEMILSDKNVSSGAKLLLLNLRFRLHYKKYCWPSQTRIAKDLGLSGRQVRNLLNELKQLGLSWDRGGLTPSDNKTRSNKYDLSFILTQSSTQDLDEQKADNEQYQQLVNDD